MSNVLAVCEQRSGAVRKISHEVVTGARRIADALGGGVDALVLGAGAVTGTDQLGRFGADKVVTLKYNLAGNGKSKILKTAGEIKLVQVRDGAVVGVHMVGDRMGEQVGEAQLIYNWEALPAEVAQLIHAHPTQNEALGEAHLALAGKPLHSHD